MHPSSRMLPSVIGGGRGRYVGAAPEGGQSGKEQTSRICIAESDGANNRPVIIASYTAIYICVPMPKYGSRGLVTGYVRDGCWSDTARTHGQ